MEENSEIHMETDVSLTTESACDTEDVMETHGDVETVIIVENTAEEELFGSLNSDTIICSKPSTEMNSSDNGSEGSQTKMVPQTTINDVRNDEEQSLYRHDQEHKTYNNKHKASRIEQLQSPLKTDDSQSTLNEQSSLPDKQNINSNEKSPTKNCHEQSPLENSKAIPETDDSKKDCDDDNHSLDTEESQDLKTSPLKGIDSNNTDKEQPVLKIDQSPKTYISRHNSQTKCDQKQNITCTISSSAVDDADSDDVMNPALNSNKNIDGTLAAQVQIPSQNSPEPALSEPDDKTINSSNTDQEEDCMKLTYTSIEPSENDHDSQTENMSDDKDQNKNISRELKSLIKSAKESKIISECNQVTSKTRKSRSTLDASLNTSVESGKIQDIRRSSVNSQKSNCSEKSEKAPKRSMRSQNPEFVNKVKQFLNSVTGKIHKTDSDEEIDVAKETQYETVYSPSKKKKQFENMEVDPTTNTNKLRTDPYCWRCHWAVEPVANEKGHPPMQCTVCPRAIHYKCLNSNERNKITAEKSWVCPECMVVLHAESSETRSPAMRKVSLGQLCELLHYALRRLKNLNGVEPFLQPVDRTVFPDYDNYIVHPMDLSLMKDNITEGLYGSTEAFLADTQWILHNSIIFNTLQSKLTGGARALVRSCKAEMGEIEACPECYAAAHARKPTWFTDVCSTPHVLLWAKLKGFPYWPAKGMTVSNTGMVDVRFFGAHDRAWVPARDCFLFCEKDPNNFRSKRQDILDSMQEAEQHIRNISRKYGQYVYPPFKTPFDPTKLTEQLKMMIPTFDGEVGVSVSKQTNSPTVPKGKSRSNSKSSKSSGNDGDVSECEDVQESRKMSGGAEIARDDDFTPEKNVCYYRNKTSELHDSEKETTRKRRRSELEEAVITIMDSSSDKRRKVETDKVVVKKETTKEIDTSKENEVNTEDNSKEANEKAQEVTAGNDKAVAGNSMEVDVTPNTTPVKTTPKVKPIRITLSRDNDRAITIPKIVRSDKEVEVDKLSDKNKSQKRRNSRHKHINSQNGKADKQEKKVEKDNIVKIIIKDKNKDTCKTKVSDDKCEKSNKTGPDANKSKEQNDDDATLAVIAREVTKANVSGLPTISSVRSLSTTAQNLDTTTVTTTSSQTTEVTITVSANSSIFTPTSTENVRNIKEAVHKLQKLRSDETPLVGRVGVRAFARMTSPEPRTSKLESMLVEVKSEPSEIEDTERQVEKVDMMKQFHLRPVNPPNANLREVRMNKVVVAPLARKTVAKQPDARIKAKKTFPQPRKVDDGRSELNSKNSMVYIPIQPPSTQAPVRPTKPITINGTANTQTVRPPVTATSAANNIVNTMTTPLVPSSLNPCVQPTTVATTNTTCLTTVTQAPTSGSNTGPANFVQVSNVSQSSVIGPTTTVSPVSTTAQLPTVGQLNAIGQVPTNVHTVPLITSVNGQWTFSLQPIMSVGGLDETSPLINGLPDRSTSLAPLPSLPGVQTIQMPLNTICSNPETPGEPPRLQQKPLLNPLDPSTPIGAVPPPSTAGPLTAKLNQNAVKLTDFFRTLLEDTLDKVDEPAAQATLLKMQIEHMQWRHMQEIREMKHNHELTVTEMRAAYEKDKARAVSEARRTAQVELEAAVKATKAKQWCAHCSQEAQFYCCWNTSYCDYPCQKAHWNTHYSQCTQQRNAATNGDNANAIEKRLQSAPESLPKSTQAPALTVGNKLTTTRVFSQDSTAQKTSIIVSMMEDQSGNQAMKCVGTYKAPGNSQVSPLVVNKQIMNTDEGSKKVVTSGGYLIVGGSTPLVTPPRRTHTIYYT
ncbi:MYND-type zinc finger-containing chromatin reader ZMYND8-like isoform X2 [Danaus plexippus]|uniref:MYND-type zinc finger-containing chromatin reader ZMYND8-like isoform X2 n=1 Tax=Danaus plexippus TaxID=13037 RepID=UPI002AB02BFA|nr:MYND-type zinc finger-containing chromatin reader ZMYND8-like isoform X2 [Danaus plexippus]